jgi:opacity protein-like surface antigen
MKKVLIASIIAVLWISPAFAAQGNNPVTSKQGQKVKAHQDYSPYDKAVAFYPDNPYRDSERVKPYCLRGFIWLRIAVNGDNKTYWGGQELDGNGKPIPCIPRE